MRILLLIALGLLNLSVNARAEEAFRFQKIDTIQQMHSYIKENFKPKVSRNSVRNVFIHSGNATLIQHPRKKNIEKYLYDINLCSRYVWRWNISADYTNENKLIQIYVNGVPVFESGPDKRTIKEMKQKYGSPGQEEKIFKAYKKRPKAHLGEKVLSYLIYDIDGNRETKRDRLAIGAGPSRVDPYDMGDMITYTNVTPWRSIFDENEVEDIAPYAGDCPNK